MKYPKELHPIKFIYDEAKKAADAAVRQGQHNKVQKSALKATRIAGKRLFYTGHKPDFAALTAIYNDYVTPEKEVSKSTIWRQKNELDFGSDSSSEVGLAKSLRADCLVGSAIAVDLPSVLKVLTLRRYGWETSHSSI